jgi:hypothetical protein
MTTNTEPRADLLVDAENVLPEDPDGERIHR